MSIYGFELILLSLNFTPDIEIRRPNTLLQDTHTDTHPKTSSGATHKLGLWVVMFYTCRVAVDFDFLMLFCLVAASAGVFVCWIRCHFQFCLRFQFLPILHILNSAICIGMCDDDGNVLSDKAFSTIRTKKYSCDMRYDQAGRHHH